MLFDDALKLVVDKIPTEYPNHMLCHFAANAARGVVLPFTAGLCRTLAEIDSATPGYAAEMIARLAAITRTGEEQYEAFLQILAEVYVTQGVVEAASRGIAAPQIVHEPGPSGKKNPECEAIIAGTWCAIEVKTPKVIAHARQRASNPWQVTARVSREWTKDFELTSPRDNPVKDFLVSAEAKFTIFERHRPNSLRLLFIIWDDFCNEPISALLSPMSGLLTEQSFHRGMDGAPVRYPHVDGIAVVRHQHQLRRATREEPLMDDVEDAMRYHHDGFPPKAFIQVPGGRDVPHTVLDALNLVPLHACLGAEYIPAEIIMWSGE
jgi:hypothetical protein